MNLTPTQLPFVSFGYLTGADLARFCPPSLLIREYALDPNSLQYGVNTAISELLAVLSTRYDTSAEMLKIGFTAAQATVILTSEAVSGVTLISGGTSYLTAPIVIFSGGGGSGAIGTAILSNGQVSGVMITQGGSGYISVPIISFSGGGPTVGAGAELSATVQNGSVISIQVDEAGQGYMTPPELFFIGGFDYSGQVGLPPPKRSTAKAFPVLSGGGIASVIIQFPGIGYVSPPTIQVNPYTPVPDTRATMLVKLLAITAIRNILGNAQNISDKMAQDFEDVRRDLYAIRNGQLNMPLPGAMKDVRSSANMVPSRFKTRG